MALANRRYGIGSCGRFLWLMIIAYVFYGMPVLAQIDLDSIQILWEEGNYERAYSELYAYRDNPFCKSARIDYLMATCLCRIPGRETLGYKFFRNILHSYSLDTSSREKVENEMQDCSTDTEPRQIVFITKKVGSGAAGTTGKIYHWLDSENALIKSDPVKVIREIPLQELSARLFHPRDTVAAKAQLENLLAADFDIRTTGHFVIASASRHTSMQLEQIGHNLENYLRIFADRFGIAIPSDMITIYMVNNTWDLMELAERIHGIEVSNSTIGYSYRDDLSVVAVIPGMHYGTLTHELFHLLVRNNFGDIPPWLDEGMAALYEVSRIIGNDIVGEPNWRGKVLARYRGLRPSIEDLLRMDWRSFSSEDGDPEAKQQATNYATARYFVLYLQDLHKLTDVFRIFQQRAVTDMQCDPGSDAVVVMQTILRKSLFELDKEFDEWFQQLRHDY